MIFFCNDTATTGIYTYLHTLSLHDALPICLVTQGEYLEFMRDGGYRRPELWLSLGWDRVCAEQWDAPLYWKNQENGWQTRSEEHTSELQSLMRISYAVFCLKKKKEKTTHSKHSNTHRNDE